MRYPLSSSLLFIYGWQPKMKKLSIIFPWMTLSSKNGIIDGKFYPWIFLLWIICTHEWNLNLSSFYPWNQTLIWTFDWKSWWMKIPSMDGKFLSMEISSLKIINGWKTGILGGKCHSWVKQWITFSSLDISESRLYLFSDLVESRAGFFLQFAVRRFK